MKRIFLSLLFWSICLAGYANNFQFAVDKLINQVDPNINMGIAVVDLDTGATLYQRNADRTFIPASNMKLFSDAAALMVLGPDYHFQSQLSTNAHMLEGGLLKGSIFIHLSGDPSLTQENLYSLLSQLSRWGIKHIQGNVVIVSSNNAYNPYAPGWATSDLKYSYGAPLAPVVLDENRLTVTVNPSYSAGQPAIVEFNDKTANLSLDNQVKTTAKGDACGVDFSMNQENRVTVRGCVGLGQWAVQQRIAVQNPLRYTQDLIKQQLTDLHIMLDGQVLLGSAPHASLLLATHNSQPITQLMADTLKPSDNLYADSLFLHSAAKLNGAPLNWQQAQPVVKNFLQQQTGISLQNAVLTDGSGLSRQDLLTPQQTVGLLRFLHDRFPLAYEYIAALPIGGYDGTLRKRFRQPTQQGLIRAKTGTMTGIVSLSGYLYTANAHTIAFAIFVNKVPGTKPAISGRYRYLIDALCAFFLQQKPDNFRINSIANPHGRMAFQQQPTQADRQRSKYAKWRGLESSLKRALQGQPVTVLFRGNELMLIDHNFDYNKVWTTLKTINSKYPFAVAVRGKSAPANNGNSPHLLWIKIENSNSISPRTWTIREGVS